MDKTSIIFAGDISFDRYMAGKWEDEELLSSDILDYFHSADHVCANVEGALTDARDNGSHGVFFHSMDPAAACVLDRIGADIWNISNNHIMDAGAEGLQNTRSLAAIRNSHTIGAGRNEKEASEPVILNEAGGIGLFGVAYMTECIPATETAPGIFRWNDMEAIGKRIREIKSGCRWCIVVSHGGEEFADLPNPYTRERYMKYLEMGADAVVAHHPHVPENYELFEGGKAIFYSLGNFIFDTDYQRVHPYTDAGVLLRLTFTENEMTFDAIGTRVNRESHRVEKGPLPKIFQNVPAEEYEKLKALNASVFLNEQKRVMRYLEPERFRDASEEMWNRFFCSPEQDGYDRGAHMDLSLIVPLADQEKEGTWKDSSLPDIVEYLTKRPV